MNGYFALKARGSGRTTRQILNAPRNAVYVVWHSSQFAYTRALMVHLGRTDLHLMSFGWIEREGYRGDHRHYVVDHMAATAARQMVKSREWRALDLLEHWQGRDYSFNKPRPQPHQLDPLPTFNHGDWL